MSVCAHAWQALLVACMEVPGSHPTCACMHGRMAPSNYMTLFDFARMHIGSAAGHMGFRVRLTTHLCSCFVWSGTWGCRANVPIATARPRAHCAGWHFTAYACLRGRAFPD